MAKKSKRRFSPRDSNTVAVLIVAVASVGLIFIWGLILRPDARVSDVDYTQSNEDAVAEGHIVCLPHKDQKTQITLECAYGLQLDDGTFYAVKDINDDYSTISTLPFDKKVRLTGSYTEEPSDTYQSVGTFTVTNSEMVLP